MQTKFNMKTSIKNGLRKMFGDKQFVVHYWRIYTPALLYGIFFAFGPIFASNLIASSDLHIMNGIYGSSSYYDEQTQQYVYVSVTQGKFINLVFTQGNSLWTAMYFFVATVARCGVGAVGSALGKNNRNEVQSLLRLLTYMVLVISVIIMLVICIDSSNILDKLRLITGEVYSGSESAFKSAVTQYVDWSAVTLFFYGMGVLYQPMFSSYKKTMEQMFAALAGFVFIMIAIPCYVSSTSSANQSLSQVIHRSSMVALFVDLYYVVIMLFFTIYSLFPRTLGFQSLNEKILSNPYYQNRNFDRLATTRNEIWRTKYFYFYTQENPTTIFNFYKTGFWFTWYNVKVLTYLGWAVFVDQIVYSIANVFLIIFSTNIDTTKAQAWKDYNTAAKPASLLNNYVYSVANSFSILPAAFVAYELGLGNKQKARTNGWRLYFWGMVTGAILMILVFILASFMPKLTVAENSSDLIPLAVGLTMVFGVSVLINSAYQITLSILFSGGNRWVQINNSLVTIINSFAIILVISDQISYNGLWSSPTWTDFYGYYVIGKSYVVVKFTICTFLMLYTNWLHTGSEVSGKKSKAMEKLGKMIRINK